MKAKELETEFDIQYVKDMVNKCFTLYDNSKVKLKSIDKTYNKRKSFIISQFKDLFISNFWR